MANKKISQLNAVTTLSNNDVFPVVQGTETKKAKISDIKSYLPTASSLLTGLLSNTDWVTFNNKQNALTLGNLTESTSSVLTITGGTGAIIGSGLTIQVKQASGSQNGFLSSTDWTTFNSKMSSLTLTTTGTSGAATLVGSTLNIPQYLGTAVTSLGGQTGATQTFSTDTTGTDFAITSATNNHKFSIPNASATARGLLTSSNWTDFNSKEPAVTWGDFQEQTSSVLTITGGTGAVRGGIGIQVKQVSASQDGYLGKGDYSTFVAKQNAITLTTTGSSGAATLINDVLNIPQYSGGGGISTLNTLTASTQTFATGTSGSDFNISSATSTHTFNIPDAGASARGVVTTGTQTLAGAKTFSSAPTFSTMTAGSVLFAGTSGLLSQDNTNLFWDNTNKRLGIGTSSPEAMIHNISTASGISTTDSPENLRLDRYVANSAATAPLVILRKARGTFSSPSAVASGDTIGVFGFRGHNGTAMTTGSRAYLIAFASENWTTTANGTYLAYGTTANGTTTGTERLRIDQDGSVLIGTTTNAGYKLDVNGTTRSVTSIESPIVRGNTTASGTLTLSSTSNATKGNIIFGANSVYDEVNDRLGIGTTTPTGTVQATGTAAGAFYGQRFTNSTGSANCTLGKARGTTSSPLIVQNGDATGGFVFEGYDGASFLGTANFTGIIDGTPSSGVVPQALRCVTGTTLANRTERFRIASDGLFTFWDGGNFVLGTSTGTKIGTATSQKLSFWNATPIVQPTTAVAAATRVGGGGTTVTDTDTFDGYTIAQIVKALRNIGLLA